MRWILVLVGLVGPAEWLAAQAAPLVAPGSRVRVRTITTSGATAHRYDGTVESISGDTLTFRSAVGGAAHRYVPAPNAQLFVLTGNRSSALRGATIGGLTGIIAGGVWGLTRQKECTGNQHLCLNRKSLAMKEGAILGVAGAITGLVIGSLDKREQWTRAWRLSSAPPESGGTTRPGVGLSFFF